MTGVVYPPPPRSPSLAPSARSDASRPSEECRDPFDVSPTLIDAARQAHQSIEPAAPNEGQDAFNAPFSKSEILASNMGAALFIIALAPTSGVSVAMADSIFGVLRHSDLVDESRVSVIVVSIMNALSRIVFATEDGLMRVRSSPSSLFECCYDSLFRVAAQERLTAAVLRRIVYCAFVAVSNRWRLSLTDGEYEPLLTESGIPRCFLTSNGSSGHGIHDSLQADFDTATAATAALARASKRQRPAPSHPPPPPQAIGWGAWRGGPSEPMDLDRDGDAAHAGDGPGPDIPPPSPPANRPSEQLRLLRHLQSVAGVPLDDTSSLSPGNFGLIFKGGAIGDPILSLVVSLPLLTGSTPLVDDVVNSTMSTPNISLEAPSGPPSAYRISVRISGDKALAKVPRSCLTSALEVSLGKGSVVRVCAWNPSGPDDNRGCWEVDLLAGNGQIFVLTAVGAPSLSLAGIPVIIFPHCRRAWQTRLPWGRLVYKISAFPHYDSVPDIVKAAANLIGPILQPREGQYGFQMVTPGSDGEEFYPPFTWYIPPPSIAPKAGTFSIAVACPEAVSWLTSTSPSLNGVPIVVTAVPQHNGEVHQRIRQTLAVSFDAPVGAFDVSIPSLP